MSEQIGRFRVLKRLGGGGFGEVFLAEDPNIGRQVAIKLFRPKDENLIAFATSSAEEGLAVLRARFLNEAKILAQLHDEPHVVDVLDFSELADGTPYYVMPYLPQSLADELGKDVFDVSALAELPDSQRPRALPMSNALDAVEQTLKGLAAAHAHGLVHRDIKPSNLMRSEKGVLRVVDFGIAKAPDGQHSTVSHLGMGSRNYMAPEQRESAKHVDARADLYAVGVVAYRALTGRLPIGRFSDPNVAVPALGKPMNDLILRLLAQDKADRPKDAGEALALFQKARVSVGQASEERTDTWVGESAEAGLRDELRPLKAKIVELLSAQGRIAQADWPKLKALAAIGDLDEAELREWIEALASRDKALVAKRKLADLIYAQVRQRGAALPEAALADFEDAAKAVGWDRTQLQTIAAQAAAELAPAPRPAAEPANEQSSPPRVERWSLPLRKLAMALGLALAVGGVGWSLVTWRQGQIDDAAKWATSAMSGDQIKDWQKKGATQTPRERFRDCVECPELVRIAAGTFVQGSPSSEAERYVAEEPMHRVSLAAFSLGRTEVTRDEFSRFVTATGHQTDAEKNAAGKPGCYVNNDKGDLGWQKGADWRNPGFAQNDSHPVVCVSWNDAQAYVDWLKVKTGKPYRLPSESELEYANRAGMTTPWPWGNDGNNGCAVANYADASLKSAIGGFKLAVATCDDGAAFTAPAASYHANKFGLHDVAGNVWEWAQDCWAGYEGASTDGRARVIGDCDRRVLRGGSWNVAPAHLRSAFRSAGKATTRNTISGFRVALDQ